MRFSAKAKWGLRKTFYILAWVAASIFLSDIIVMLFISRTGLEIHIFWIVLLNAALPIVILVPSLYFLLFRPLTQEIEYLDDRHDNVLGLKNKLEMYLAEYAKLELKENHVSEIVNVDELKLTQKETFKKNKLAEDLIDSNFDGVLAYDLEFRIIVFNHAMEQISGKRREDVIGKNIFELFSFLKSEKLDQYYYDALKGKVVFPEMKRVYVPDTGKTGYYERKYGPLYDENGKIIGGIVNVRDVTRQRGVEVNLKKDLADLESINERLRFAMNQVQQKDQNLFEANEHLEETMRNIEKTLAEVELRKELALSERNRLQIIIDKMGEGVLVIDKNKNVEIINERAKEMLGYSGSKEISPGYLKFFVLQFWKELNESGDRIVKKEVKVQRPKELVLLITLARAGVTSDDMSFVAVLRDITVEKQIEKVKSDFVANVSHEIRAPMAPIKDALALVADGTAGPINDTQKKFLGVVETNIERLTRLINDLLDLSKIEAGKFELRKELFDVRSVVNEIVGGMQPYAQNKKIELSFACVENKIDILADRDRISQVVINLIGNAFKFTAEGGKISVSLSKLDHKVRISIADTGQGMTVVQTEMLFERFKQLAMPQQVKGTGLGLAISKSIVDMHGGRMWVESEPGKGSTFNVELPK